MPESYLLEQVECVQKKSKERAVFWLEGAKVSTHAIEVTNALISTRNGTLKPTC